MLIAGGAAALRAILESRVAAHGYSVEVAADASAALSAIVMHAPDAVVLADAGAGFDVREVCRRIRAHTGSRRTPVVLLLPAGEALPVAPSLDADVLPIDDRSDALVTWLDAQLPPAASAADWLRLTLAQTADDAGAAATTPGDATADVTWRL
ncbi:MAG: hypothetical protein ABI880_16870, partial [Acidobacteriota bacterium]